MITWVPPEHFHDTPVSIGEIVEVANEVAVYQYTNPRWLGGSRSLNGMLLQHISSKPGHNEKYTMLFYPVAWMQPYPPEFDNDDVERGEEIERNDAAPVQ